MASAGWSRAATRAGYHAANAEITTPYTAAQTAVKFLGFIALYSEGKDEDEDDDGKAISLPELKAGDELGLLGLFSEQHFTQPPPRYTEATLIKTLEQKGIGRPSTYAPIISTIQERGYVLKESGKLYPDVVGIVVNDLLTQHFPRIVDLGFTARLEKQLDAIAQGKKEWVSVLRGFYTPFDDLLRIASEAIEKVRIVRMTEESCPDCSRPMVIKTGRYGKFLACSGYPECKKTMPFLVKTGVACPDCGEGELVERISKKKRRFYGCNRYPACKFATNRKPVPQPCPRCGKLLTMYRDGWAKCTVCEYKGDLAELEKVEAAA